jgi:hypothetical protein
VKKVVVEEAVILEGAKPILIYGEEGEIAKRAANHT